MAYYRTGAGAGDFKLTSYYVRGKDLVGLCVKCKDGIFESLGQSSLTSVQFGTTFFEDENVTVKTYGTGTSKSFGFQIVLKKSMFIDGVERPAGYSAGYEYDKVAIVRDKI